MHESIGFYRSQTFGQLYTEAISTVIPIGPCSFGCYSLASFIMELMFTISPSTPPFSYNSQPALHQLNFMTCTFQDKASPYKNNSICSL